MKKFYSIKLLVLSCLALFTGFLTSCENETDDGPNAGQVELLSFGPSGVQHGEEIRFIGYNLNKVEAIEFAGATVAKTGFLEQTPTLIRLVVPQETGEGLVTLKTATGDVTSKTVLSFEVPVVVTSITEEARPGANITITGDYMNWVTGVVFANDTVTEFVSQTMNELVLQVPIDAQTSRLILLTGGTEPLVIETEQELIVTLPSITGLAPNPVERGTDVTITGENLDLTMGVLFNGITDPVTAFVSIAPGQLVVMVPAEAARGVVTLIAHSGVQVMSGEVLQLVGDLPPLAPLPYTIFDEARTAGWDDWGWGGASVWNSTEKVRQGNIAAKKTYDGGDAIRVHNNTPLATSGYADLVFATYGGPGTNGKTMSIVINEGWGSPYQFPVVEGEWATYTIPLSELGSPATINDLLFQATGWAGVVHYDYIGLK